MKTFEIFTKKGSRIVIEHDIKDAIDKFSTLRGEFRSDIIRIQDTAYNKTLSDIPSMPSREELINNIKAFLKENKRNEIERLMTGERTGEYCITVDEIVQLVEMVIKEREGR